MKPADLRHVKHADDLHRAMAAAWDFPDYYGANWDAFIDVVDEQRAHTTDAVLVLELLGAEDFATHLPDQAAQLLAAVAFINADRRREGEAAVVLVPR